ncbi:hypothetical protein RQP54_10625 [Curvibacter sp. APW13]|uniref:substrate-binding periplasmic protein n=1 Tax=Curvibacter sp. APW13 TaxID=3077236 RepID=UPI0028DEF830|nr:hypothetical protein [Curvibacter sp. APW13]MDT8991314.1 hypothetical protein [Curvibacter sp. APW13]
MRNDRWYRVLTRTLVWIGLTAGATNAAYAQPSPVLVLGTPRPDGNYAGTLLRRIHTELFNRLGVPIEIRTLPTARLALELGNGGVDGDLSRPLAFGDSQPNLVRIEEPVLEITYALWATNPGYRLTKLEQLRTSHYTVTYTRGVVFCEDLLKAQLAPDQVVDVTTTANALHMLHYGRNELHCGVDAAVLSEAGNAEFAGKPAPIRVLTLSKPDLLYPYLQRKHAALAVQAAVTLRKMKADGTLERLRRETLREFNLAVGQ